MKRAARLAAVMVAMGPAACERNVAVGYENAPIAIAGTSSSGGPSEPPGGASVGGAGVGGSSLGGEAGTFDGGSPAGGAAGESGTAGLLWHSDHETGNLDQWLSDGNGSKVIDGNGKVEVSSDRARSGEFSLAVTITANNSKQNQGLLERDLRLEEGRYGAWYYLPKSLKTDYWVLMKFSNGAVNRFDIDIEVPSGGQPHLRLYEHGKGWLTERAEPAVPIGQWVHIEVLYRSTPQDDGRLVVFQDGEQVLDTGPRATADDDHVVFACGSSSRYVSPAPYTVFIDDASIQAAVMP